jgi:hypothetical protein
MLNLAAALHPSPPPLAALSRQRWRRPKSGQCWTWPRSSHNGLCGRSAATATWPGNLSKVKSWTTAARDSGGAYEDEGHWVVALPFTVAPKECSVAISSSGDSLWRLHPRCHRRSGQAVHHSMVAYVLLRPATAPVCLSSTSSVRTCIPVC